jgi:hypothetical protein
MKSESRMMWHGEKPCVILMKIVPVADSIAKGNNGHPDANDQYDEKWDEEILAPQGSRAEDQHHNQQSSQRKIHVVMAVLIIRIFLTCSPSHRFGERQAENYCSWIRQNSERTEFWRIQLPIVVCTLPPLALYIAKPGSNYFTNSGKYFTGKVPLSRTSSWYGPSSKPVPRARCTF